MPVRCCFQVLRLAQIETFYDSCRSQVEHIAHDRRQFPIRQFAARAFRVDGNGNRFLDADRIGYLHLYLFRKACLHNVFRYMPRRIGAGPIHLGSIFSTEGPSAVGAFSAIRVHDDLAARKPRIGMRPPEYEPSRGIHMQNVLVVQQVIVDHPRQQMDANIGLDIGLFDAGIVLS